MSLSKHQLSAALKRKCLSLDEKIVILDYANEHPKMGCRKIAEHFSVGKTAVSNILKGGKNLRKDFEFFKGNYKKRRHGKYHVTNEILCNCYGRYKSGNAYPDGPLLQEEAMEIKRRLSKEEFAGFTASAEVSTTTIQAWIERLPELCQDYEPRNEMSLDYSLRFCQRKI